MLRAVALLSTSAISLGFGLSLPVLTVHPGFGEFTAVIRTFAPAAGAPKSISIAGGIVDLLREGQYLVAILLLLFSVLFPLWKLGVLSEALYELGKGLPVTRQLHVIERWGKYSMLDVLVVALLVIVIKTLPGDTTVGVGWGLGFFAVSVIASLKLPHLVTEIEKKTSSEKDSA